MELATALGRLYLQLGGSAALGWFLGRWLPPVTPRWIGLFLFWVGSPLSNIIFIYRADLSGGVWLAPVVAWVGYFCGLGLALLWWRSTANHLDGPSRASFLLTSVFGNTGYIGFPVVISLVGDRYAGWALFYDLLGTVLGVYSLGVFLAVRHGGPSQMEHLGRSVVLNPVLWSLVFVLWLRQFDLPWLRSPLWLHLGWAMVFISLILIGMRLSEMKQGLPWQKSSASLAIKMLLVPLMLGWALGVFSLDPTQRLVLVLQMASPPAIATLVLAENFNLDRQLTVSTIVAGSTVFLITIPLWLWLFVSPFG